MNHPSIRLRLVVGTISLVAVTLLFGGVILYRSFERSQYKEVDTQLLQAVSLLAKSSELEVGKVEYEWQDAIKSPDAPEIEGFFVFLDLRSGRITKSPELGGLDLPLVYGKPYKPVIHNTVLPDGRMIRYAGMLHYPSIDQEALDESESLGVTLVPQDHPQVVVAARETGFLIGRLAHFRADLTQIGIAALFVIAGAIIGISSWSLRSISQFTDNLVARSVSGRKTASEVPRKLPSELIQLAETFNATLEKVETAREREKEFAFHAAHELRTPIAGIYVTLEQAIARDRSSDDMRERIAGSMAILGQMRGTLESLMKLARMRGNLELPSRSVVFIDELLDEAVDLVQEEIESKGSTFSTSIPEDAGGFMADKNLLRIVLSNLIGNSVRYSPRNTEISVTVAPDPGWFTLVCVNELPRQTDVSSIEKWFEPFHRASSSTDEGGHHAGLGLSLAREAASLMGGTLVAELGAGNTIQFTLRIPLENKEA